MSERVNTSFGPESSGPIQVIPPGLLGFLQLKNSGQNPHSINLEITPHLDLTKWMFEARHEFVIIVCSVAAATPGFSGDPALITVPVGQYWYVMEAKTEITISPTERVLTGPAWRQSNTAPASSNVIVPDGLRADVTAGAANTASVISTARDFFLPSGAQAGVYTSIADYAGAHNVVLTLRFVRLPL